MLGSILIIAISSILFLYWCRYTCLLILSAKTATDYTSEVAEANRLTFLSVQSRLRDSSATDHPEQLDKLRESLHRDYQLVTYLLSHAAEFRVDVYSLERRMLMADYRVMKAWYALIRPISAKQARAALEEMSQIVAHFANVMGERVAYQAN